MAECAGQNQPSQGGEMKDMTTSNVKNVGLTPEMISQIEAIIRRTQAEGSTPKVVSPVSSSRVVIAEGKPTNWRKAVVDLDKGTVTEPVVEQPAVRLAQIVVDGVVVGNVEMRFKNYSTGSDGYFTFGKLAMGGARYQFSGNAVRIGSKK